VTIATRTGPTTRFFDVPDGTKLAWDSAGDGPTVLFVHGIGYTRRKWDPQIEPVVRAGYRAVRFDLRGFGESVTPEGQYVMDQFLDDLVRFGSVLGVDRFHLVGHSLGGMIAQRYALEHSASVESLTLVSTTSHNGRRGSAFAKLMVLFAERGFDAVMADDSVRQEAESVLVEAFGTAVPLTMLRRGLEERSLSRANAWRACIGFTAKDDLVRIACPALVLHGTADTLIPFKAGELVAEAIPGARFVREEGAGHSLPKERAESFNRELIDFLAAASRGSRSP
jgi:pimeloyl-ACP methyl ester carboxylesterase